MQIPVVRNVLEANEKMAAHVRRQLSGRKILTLNLISSPGAGKTSLLERTLRDLAGEFRMAVIEGDLQTDNDARRVAATGAQAVQINTDGGCHLDSNMILTALDNLELDGLDILFIENVGNLVCPAEFDTGAVKNAVILSVPEGDDKPLKYPLMFQVCDVVLVNKMDVLPYFNFDLEKCTEYVKMRNPKAQVIPICAATGEGMDAWYDWLRREVRAWRGEETEKENGHE